MSAKTLDFIILEGEQEKRLPLVKISLHDLPKRAQYKKLISLTPEFLLEQGVEHTIQSLVQNYIKGIVKVHNLFTRIVKETANENRVNYQTITEVGFVYATHGAYSKINTLYPKEKESDADIIPAGHFDNDKEIILSLENNLTEKYLQENIIHEHGHYLHKFLHPEKYENCDPTLKEVMSIFVQERCNYKREYVKKTPHYRAQQILHQLENKNNFKRATARAQWNFLVQFTNHQELSDYTNKLP